MKKHLQRILILLTFLVTSFLNAQCWFSSLHDNLKVGSEEFKSFIKNNEEGFASYKILYEEASTLKTNVEELTLVSQNLNEINKIGYLKWKASLVSIEDLANFLRTIDETTTIAELEAKGIKAIFRGTTRNAEDMLFSGNTNTIEYGISTSTDPMVALIFAIETATTRQERGVLQIAIPANISSLKMSRPNVRVKYELEIILETPAENYSKLSTIEISTEDARKLVKEIYGEDIPSRIDFKGFDNAVNLTRELKHSTLEQAYEFYQKAIKYNIKK